MIWYTVAKAFDQLFAISYREMNREVFKGLLMVDFRQLCRRDPTVFQNCCDNRYRFILTPLPDSVLFFLLQCGVAFQAL